MKKVLALLISAILLVSLFAIPASADEGSMFWVTHFNNGSVEGAGAIFTDSDAAGAWWHHVAFAPVEGKEDVYEIVEFCIGDGNAYSLAIPEGGFVYAVNTGNNWPSLFEQNGATGDGSTGLWFDDAEHAAMPDYTSDNCSTAFTMVNDWCVGLTFKISGIDLEGQTIPTSTTDKQWYEDDYVCTATIAIYTGDEDTEDPATSEDVSEDVSEDASAEASETVSTETSEEASTATSTDASEEASENGGAASEDAAASTDASEEPTTTEEGGLSTVALIAIIAGAVVVIGVIVLVVVKSKKK